MVEKQSESVRNYADSLIKQKQVIQRYNNSEMKPNSLKRQQTAQ